MGVITTLRRLGFAILATLLGVCPVAAQSFNVGQGKPGVNPWHVDFLSPQHIICDSGCSGSSGTTGQQTMANSAPVVIASDQSSVHTTVDNASIAVTGTFFQATQPVSGTVTANAGTGPATPWKVDLSGTGANTTALLVTGTGGTFPVTGTFWQTTQPVSIATMPSTPVTGTFWQATQPVSGTVSVSNFPATQPVSGTVTANQGTANTAANGWMVKNTDGTNVAAVKAASTAAAAADPALVVAVSPNNSVAVTGTFFQATQPVSGTVTANAGSGTFTVSGTVTATQGTAGASSWLTNDAATSATGSAVPAKATFIGGQNSSGLAGVVLCDKSAAISAGAAATTQIVALSGSTVIYVCGFSVTGAGAAGTLTWKYGTGTTCGTGTTSLSGAYATVIGTPINYGGAMGSIMRTAAGNALCITMATTSATAAGILTYAQF